MQNKTCGGCKYHNPISGICIKLGKKPSKTLPSCPYRPTNGDRIIAGGMRALAEFKRKHQCDCCVYLIGGNCTEPVNKKDRCELGLIAWLNAPAESEGKDVQHS